VGYVCGSNLGTTVDVALACTAVPPKARRVLLWYILLKVVVSLWAVPALAVLPREVVRRLVQAIGGLGGLHTLLNLVVFVVGLGWLARSQALGL